MLERPDINGNGADLIAYIDNFATAEFADIPEDTTDDFAVLLEFLGFARNDHLFVCHDYGGKFTPQITSAVAAPAYVSKMLAPRGANVWFTSATYPPTKARRTSAEATGLKALRLDLDYKDTGLRSEDNARTLIDNLSAMGMPSAIVHSGGGMQPYWPITGGTNTELAAIVLKRFETWAKTVASELGLGSLDTVSDMARVLRVPGTVNNKEEYGTPRPVTLEICDDGDILDLADVAQFLDEIGIPAISAKDVNGAMADPVYAFTGGKCNYFSAFMKGSFEETPVSRHTWLVNKFVRLNVAAINGCVSEEEFKDARGAIEFVFHAMLEMGGFEGGARDAKAAEVASAWTWAAEKAGGKDAEQRASEWGCTGGCKKTSAPGVDPLAELEAAVFEASPYMLHIRQAARSRLVSPWGLLLDVLARIAGEVESECTLPPLIGARGSLNFAGALVGLSGQGKSVTHSVGADLMGVVTAHEIGAGTGEGIMQTFLRWIPGDKKAGIEGHFVEADIMRAVLFADEIGQIGAIQARGGQTFGPIIRSMWSGSAVGTTNADTQRRRHLRAHSYRLAIVAGVQPGLADILLDDADAGTPQRWVWLPVADPSMPDVTPEWPGILPGHPLTPLGGIEVVDPVADVIRDEHRKRARGDGEALDGHMLFTRLKVASLLALMHGGRTVTEAWWGVAGVIMVASAKTRDACVRAVQIRADAERIAQGRGDVIRQKGARIAAVQEGERFARAVHAVVAKGSHSNAKHGADEGCTRRCLTFALRNYKEADKDGAIELASDLGWIEERDGRWFPGASRPSE